MYKKITLAILFSCFSFSSYAYTIGANLTVENKTDVALEMIVNQPNHQKQKIIKLPAHATIHDYMENGENDTGWLYQYDNATFTIEANGKIYAQGQIVYYVGGAYWRKFTFLDSISTADGIKIDTNYTCKNGGNNTLNNSFVIEGTPDKTIAIAKLPEKPLCKGLKTAGNFQATCIDGSNTSLGISQHTDCSDTDFGIICVTHNQYCDDIGDCYGIGNKNNIDQSIDNYIGNLFCGSW